MGCNRARRILARKASRGIGTGDERLLADHLRVCPDCAGIENQLERTWNALELHPSVEPSPGFGARLKARLRAEPPQSPARWTWRPNRKWQWIAAAACILLTAVLLTRSGPIRQHSRQAAQATAVSVADPDRWDDQFLEDLEQTLQFSNPDYLSAYDQWSVGTPETTRPGSSKAGLNHQTRKKEPL